MKGVTSSAGSGLADEIPLSKIAAEATQQVPDFDSLDALGDDAQPHAVRQLDRRGHNHGFIGVVRHAIRERSILSSSTGRRAELRERGVSGSEVIHGKAHARDAQELHMPRGEHRIAHDRALGDLQ